ncbi:oxidation resistance protein 1 isoform X2 [Kryptolebias marmoratus]|uniref:oxidation resistance protein 1 isoform X2 n=1 Tax=Kryptolebias marmoratus TaxID=37003 RepID=UPI0007F8DDED|nr:oxidation resistance protein 1 isoform X2 [Kryptolebias marmoratus]
MPQTKDKQKMAQSVRRPETLGAMNLKPQGDKTRTSYFCNVKSRLGSKLPAGVSQPPQFAKPPWDTPPQAQTAHEAAAGMQHQNRPVVSRPLDHIPHIRNPKLRQYYLQGTSWDLNSTLGTKAAGSLDGSASSEGLPGDTVFSVSSKFNSSKVFSGQDEGNPSSHNSARLNSAAHIHTELVAKVKATSIGEGSSLPELDPGPKEKPEDGEDRECLETMSAQPQSPSPEAEYDKLLDVEAVSLPDGQLCLLALPPECCEGEGPEAMLYLKLICRYITYGKGVVAGILLVTSNKIFFDPSKTHPLVKEHGCEEYLLSCSVDTLASVSFFSDISHVHFNTSQQRRDGKGKSIFQKLRNAKSRAGGVRNRRDGESRPALVSPESKAASEEEEEEEEEAEGRDVVQAERELGCSSLEVLSEESAGGLAVLSSAATFCCGGQETDCKEAPDTERSSVKSQSAVPRRTSSGSLAGWMFVRLRVQSSAGKRKKASTKTKTLPRRDAWLALSQQSADDLRAYLKRLRPDLCVLEGEEEGDQDEEGFVLIEDKEEEEDGEEEEEMFQTQHSSGDDWEMVPMEEGKDKAALVIDREPEGLSNVVEGSHILEASHIRELCKELPPRTVGLTWRLAYSTSRHGASLKSLYRKLSAADSPVLIVIKDALDEMFGAFLSHPLRPSEAFYGTGETFLFMLHPRFKCFRWTGENSFFIKGDLDSFAVGGGSGHFGLWVDENLYLGRSSPCYTFNNCCLSETDDFRIMELEVWTFSS